MVSLAAPKDLPFLRGRVLVVDDNAVNPRLTIGQLARLGCSGDVVGDGREALTALERIAYDAVLMDCQMPELDGYEATRELRQREKLHGLKRMVVVAMTAEAMFGDRERCLAAGMDDYLAKPLRIQALADILAHWLPAVDRPILDEAILQRLTMETRDYRLVQAALADYAGDAEKYLQDIAGAADALDRPRLRRAAHRLKGSSTIIGATIVADICLRLEDPQAQVEIVAPTVAALRHALHATVLAIGQRQGPEDQPPAHAA